MQCCVTITKGDNPDENKQDHYQIFIYTHNKCYRGDTTNNSGSTPVNISDKMKPPVSDQYVKISLYKLYYKTHTHTLGKFMIDRIPLNYFLHFKNSRCLIEKRATA